MQKIKEGVDTNLSSKELRRNMPDAHPLRFWGIVKECVSIGTETVPIIGTVVGFFIGILIAMSLSLKDNLHQKKV